MPQLPSGYVPPHAMPGSAPKLQPRPDAPPPAQTNLDPQSAAGPGMGGAATAQGVQASMPPDAQAPLAGQPQPAAQDPAQQAGPAAQQGMPTGQPTYYPQWAPGVNGSLVYPDGMGPVTGTVPKMGSLSRSSGLQSVRRLKTGREMKGLSGMGIQPSVKFSLSSPGGAPLTNWGSRTVAKGAADMFAKQDLAQAAARLQRDDNEEEDAASTETLPPAANFGESLSVHGPGKMATLATPVLSFSSRKSKRAELRRTPVGEGNFEFKEVPWTRQGADAWPSAEETYTPRARWDSKLPPKPKKGITNTKIAAPGEEEESSWLAPVLRTGGSLALGAILALAARRALAGDSGRVYDFKPPKFRPKDMPNDVLPPDSSTPMPHGEPVPPPSPAPPKPAVPPKLPPWLPSPENVPFKLVNASLISFPETKSADREDKLLDHMQSKGDMSKSRAVAIAKSRGWVRQDGKHLELTEKGEGPRHNVDVPESEEKHAAEMYELLESDRLSPTARGFLKQCLDNGLSDEQVFDMVLEASLLDEKVAEDLEPIMVKVAAPWGQLWQGARNLGSRIWSGASRAGSAVAQGVDKAKNLGSQAIAMTPQPIRGAAVGGMIGQGAQDFGENVMGWDMPDYMAAYGAGLGAMGRSGLGRRASQLMGGRGQQALSAVDEVTSAPFTLQLPGKNLAQSAPGKATRWIAQKGQALEAGAAPTASLWAPLARDKMEGDFTNAAELTEEVFRTTGGDPEAMAQAREEMVTRFGEESLPVMMWDRGAELYGTMGRALVDTVRPYAESMGFELPDGAGVEALEELEGVAADPRTPINAFAREAADALTEFPELAKVISPEEMASVESMEDFKALLASANDRYQDMSGGNGILTAAMDWLGLGDTQFGQLIKGLTPAQQKFFLAAAGSLLLGGLGMLMGSRGVGAAGLAGGLALGGLGAAWPQIQPNMPSWLGGPEATSEAPPAPGTPGAGDSAMMNRSLEGLGAGQPLLPDQLMPGLQAGGSPVQNELERSTGEFASGQIS